MACTERQPTVALFKATTSAEPSDDRYVNVLNEHNYLGIVIPTLAFEFDLDELKSRLLRPENYAGLVKSVYVKCTVYKLKSFPRSHSDKSAFGGMLSSCYG